MKITRSGIHFSRSLASELSYHLNPPMKSTISVSNPFRVSPYAIRPNWYMAISTGCWNAIRTSSGTPVWIRDQTKAVKTHSCVQWSLPTRKPLPPIWMAFSLRKIYHSFRQNLHAIFQTMYCQRIPFSCIVANQLCR